MNFYSEYGEDAFLHERYADFFRTPFFYVDVGCAHPEIGSNTAFLRDLGWSGLHIDGDEHWRAHWRPCFIHAVIHTQPEVHFAVNPVHVLSRVGDAVPNTPTRTLESILEEHRVDGIGLLSIDCEGQEFEVLKSMDLERHRPKFIVAEYNTAGIGEDFQSKEYLMDNGYQVIHQTVANFIYEYM